MNRGLKWAIQKTIAASTLTFEGEVLPGQVGLLQAPSGSGKTTVLKVLLGLESAESARIWLDGMEITATPVHARNLGWVPQDAGLIEHLSVMDNVTVGLRARGRSRKEAAQVVTPWLERWDLTKTLRTPVAHLSGGERTRIAWLRAWVWGPRALVMDEPFAGLDAELARTMWTDFSRELDAHPIPVLMVLHHQDDITLVESISKHLVRCPLTR